MEDQFARVAALLKAEPVVASDTGLTGDMRRLCSAASRALMATGVGMSVMVKDGARGLSAASDIATERLEELQLTLGEGPCIEAFNRRRPVLVPQIGGGAIERWPGYAPAIYASGVRAVFAFPLQVGAARLGILDVFRGEEGVLSVQELGLALTFGEVAVATLLDGQYRARDEDDDALGDVLGPRTELFQAQGMVMVQLGVPIADALAVIRAHAYAHNRSLRDIAADIVARRFSFESEQQA